MRFLLDTIRRILTAALVIGLLACAVEVALRLMNFHRDGDSVAFRDGKIPRLPSRATGTELPISWSGAGQDAETGTTIPLRINSLGLRGPEIVWKKPAGTLRILCLGDESTLADRLPEESTYTGRMATILQGRLPQPVEVINCGLPGGCPLTELILYRRLLAQLDPDLVIVHVDVSDAADDRAARRSLRVDAAGLPAAVVHPTLDVPPSALGDLTRHFAVMRWIERRLGGALANETPAAPQERFQHQLLAWAANEEDERTPQVLAPLAELNSLLAERGAQLVVATYPNAWQTAELLNANAASGRSNDLLSRPAKLISAACRAWQITSLDLTPTVLRHPHAARLYLPGGGGLSSEGHGVYAGELVQLLTSPSGPRESGERSAPTRR